MDKIGMVANGAMSSLNTTDIPLRDEASAGGGDAGGGSGMPCKFELTMEFCCYFLFTFIIYFCVFAFFPYDGVIKKVVTFIQTIFKKTIDFFYGLFPNSVKKRASKLFPSAIVTFFKETLPNALRKKKDDQVNSLKIRLEKIKRDIDKKINKNRKFLKKTGKDGILTKIHIFWSEQYLKISRQLKVLWEKFKNKILPALIISFIYYIIWFIFFKVIPPVLKYLISIAQQFKQS